MTSKSTAHGAGLCNYSDSDSQSDEDSPEAAQLLIHKSPYKIRDNIKTPASYIAQNNRSIKANAGPTSILKKKKSSVQFVAGKELESELGAAIVVNRSHEQGSNVTKKLRADNPLLLLHHEKNKCSKDDIPISEIPTHLNDEIKSPQLNSDLPNSSFSNNKTTKQNELVQISSAIISLPNLNNDVDCIEEVESTICVSQSISENDEGIDKSIKQLDEHDQPNDHEKSSELSVLNRASSCSSGLPDDAIAPKHKDVSATATVETTENDKTISLVSAEQDCSDGVGHDTACNKSCQTEQDYPDGVGHITACNKSCQTEQDYPDGVGHVTACNNSCLTEQDCAAGVGHDTTCNKSCQTDSTLLESQIFTKFVHDIEEAKVRITILQNASLFYFFLFNNEQKKN